MPQNSPNPCCCCAKNNRFTTRKTQLKYLPIDHEHKYDIDVDPEKLFENVIRVTEHSTMRLVTARAKDVTPFESMRPDCDCKEFENISDETLRLTLKEMYENLDAIGWRRVDVYMTWCNGL